MGVIFATNNSTGTVLFINSLTGQIINSLFIGGINMFEQAITPDGGRLCVVDTARNVLSVIDIRNVQLVADIPVGLSPTSVAFTPDGLNAFVTNQGSNSISVINLRSNQVIASVTVPNPTGIAVMPVFGTGSKAFVTRFDGFVNVYSLQGADLNFIETIAIGTGTGPFFPEISRTGNRLIVSNILDSSVSVIDTFANTQLAKIPVDAGPLRSKITDDGLFLYVACQGASTVVEISLTTLAVFRRVRIRNNNRNSPPSDVAFDPAGNQFVYIRNGQRFITRYERGLINPLVLVQSTPGTILGQSLLVTPVFYTIPTGTTAAISTFRRQSIRPSKPWLTKRIVNFYRL